MNKLVIADDSITIRTFLKRMMEKNDFSIVAEAENGQDAIEAVITEKADLLLLDINMPIMTGIEALPKVLDASPETVVIMLSSVSDRDTVGKALDLGAANYIVKNNDWDAMEKTILETWELNRLD